MTRTFFVLVLATAAALVVVPAAATASPQPTAEGGIAPPNNTTAPPTERVPNATTTTPTAPPKSEATANTSAASTVVAQVDSDLRVLSYEYRNGVFRITFQNTAKVAKRVTVSDASPIEGKGAASFNIRTYRILPGKETVEMQVQGKAAVSITTRESLRNGEGVYLSEEPADNPFSAFGGTGGLLAGIGTSVSVSLLAAWFVVWKEADGVEVAG
jgi:hypothetical protein